MELATLVHKFTSPITGRIFSPYLFPTYLLNDNEEVCRPPGDIVVNNLKYRKNFIRYLIKIGDYFTFKHELIVSIRFKYYSLIIKR